MVSFKLFFLLCSIFMSRVLPVGLVDDTWHHVCVTWVARDGLLDVYIDGERTFQTEDFWSSAIHLGIEGTATN